VRKICYNLTKTIIIIKTPLLSNCKLKNETLATRPTLIDFGLTREYSIGQLGSMTNAKTDGYAPIEQYERKGEFAPYTDVYALAATLYSLLTAEIPFPANFRKTGIPLPPPKQFNDKISDRVNDAILAGMVLEPNGRPQTVREWLELLIPFIDEPTPDLVEEESSQENLEPTIFVSSSGGIGIRELKNPFVSKNSFVFESVISPVVKHLVNVEVY
jgi:serine/threonine protein kinase